MDCVHSDRQDSGRMIVSNYRDRTSHYRCMHRNRRHPLRTRRHPHRAPARSTRAVMACGPDEMTQRRASQPGQCVRKALSSAATHHDLGRTASVLRHWSSSPAQTQRMASLQAAPPAAASVRVGASALQSAQQSLAVVAQVAVQMVSAPTSLLMATMEPEIVQRLSTHLMLSLRRSRRRHHFSRHRPFPVHVRVTLRTRVWLLVGMLSPFVAEVRVVHYSQRCSNAACHLRRAHQLSA